MDNQIKENINNNYEERSKLIEEQRKRKELEVKQESLKIKKFLTGVFYSFFILLILWLSILFSFSQNIWFMERFFGMISYILFFLTVLVGILRKLGPKFIWTIKYHKPTAIWAFMFMLGHVIAVIFDNFKWGYQLNILVYFGLDFSNQWLWPTSVGAIAMWIFTLVVITSIGKNMLRFGGINGLWKKIHYLSYIGFILMSVHALLLGTDFKYMSYSNILFISAIIMNIIIAVLYIIRLIYPFLKRKLNNNNN